ncbi:MAG: hypothetical protein HKN78_09435 [Sphingomonadaceae bacterium]|nr:hypothetical protein [Sphingomonadaceae bacterium]
MGPGYFVLAIMGCADGGSMCAEIGRRETVFRSEAACMAESDAALIEASIEPYPLLLAECRSVTQRVAEAASATAG